MTMSALVTGNRLRSDEAARIAREKFSSLIEHGRAQGRAVLEHVASMQPRDRLIPEDDLRFIVDPRSPQRIAIETSAAPAPIAMHPFALGQVTDRAGMPRTYLGRLMEPENASWGPALAVENFNRLFRAGRGPDDEESTGAYLARSVVIESDQREEVRGFLSSRFKRLDSRPILAAFADACQRVGALPIEGHVTETRVALKVVLGRIYEPVPNEILVFGMLFENSDFGNGALQVSFTATRLICTNGMVMERSLRKVHLGSRLTAGVAWSEQTIAAETEATASAVHDLALARLNDRSVQHLVEGIRRANEESISPAKASEYLKRYLLKAEVDAVTAAYNSPDVEMMPAGNSRWRLANAISWVAGNTDDLDRKLHLQKAAGALLPIPEAA